MIQENAIRKRKPGICTGISDATEVVLFIPMLIMNDSSYLRVNLYTKKEREREREKRTDAVKKEKAEKHR